MKLGVPKEIKSHEYRVGMTPQCVHAYSSEGHEVIIEKGAGIGSGYEDAEYENHGAIIIDDRKFLYQTSDMIVKVKEPLKEELSDFLQCIIQGKPTSVTGLDGLKALRIAEAVLESAETDKLVNL